MNAKKFQPIVVYLNRRQLLWAIGITLFVGNMPAFLVFVSRHRTLLM
jgi:hypothetical protein